LRVVCDAWHVVEGVRQLCGARARVKQACLHPLIHPSPAGIDKLLGLELSISPVKNFGGDSLELSKWLFWRGASDGRFATAMVLFTPAGLTGEAADAAAAQRAAFEAATSDLLRFTDLRFASVSSDAILEDYEIARDRQTLVVYMDHDEGRVIYEGPSDAVAIRSFLLSHNVPLVTTVWHRSLQIARRRVGALALFFVSHRQAEDLTTISRLKAALGTVAQELLAEGAIQRGAFTIGIVNGGKYKDWLREYGMPMVRGSADSEGPRGGSMCGAEGLCGAALCQPGARPCAPRPLPSPHPHPPTPGRAPCHQL